MSSIQPFKFPIYFMPGVFNRINPFHMAKEIFCRLLFEKDMKKVLLVGMRAMRALVNNCDCVIEIRDARVPLSSCNSEFEELYANKQRIILINKIDIADKKKTMVISDEFKKQDGVAGVLYSNCKSQVNIAIRKIMPILKRVFIQENEAKSLKSDKPIKYLGDRQYKVLVCGIPNVGKSSFINSTRRHYMAKGGKATPVGKKPGVTRSVMNDILISKSPRIMILDTPGIMAPNISDPITGIKLALTGTFPDHLIGEEVIAEFLLYTLNKQNNDSYLDFCGLHERTESFDHVVETLATKNNLWRKVGEPDYRKCSIMLISAFRNGNFGNLTLDGYT